MFNGDISWETYKGDFIWYTILFYPLLLLAIPVAYVGSIAEWSYYYALSIFFTDKSGSQRLEEMWDNKYTDPTSIARKGVTKAFTVPLDFWYGFVLRAWNWFVNILMFLWAMLKWNFAILWIVIVYLDEVNWVIFDNFYTSLQWQVLNYDQFLKSHAFGFITTLIGWPLMVLWQYIYYLFQWPSS